MALFETSENSDILSVQTHERQCFYTILQKSTKAKAILHKWSVHDCLIMRCYKIASLLNTRLGQKRLAAVNRSVGPIILIWRNVQPALFALKDQITIFK